LNTLIPILNNNIKHLRDLISVLKQLDNPCYTTVNQYFRSSIGAHIRHVIEHYQEFLHGIDNKYINYDKRKRQLALEHNPDLAIEAINALIVAFENMSKVRMQDTQVTVFHETCDSSEEEHDAPSFLSRELLFLHSHLVHHLAIIEMILRFLQVKVQFNIGVAPSTLKYLKAQK